MTTPTPPEVREIAAEALYAKHGHFYTWEQQDDGTREWYRDRADAVLSAVTPVIRQQVADRIEDEIRSRIIAGAPSPLQPGSRLVARDIVDWLVDIVNSAAHEPSRSHVQQPTGEQNG